MSLRGKLLLAQLPLGIALMAIAVLAGTAVTKLGEQSAYILKDNYRSVLAAQRMKDSLEELDRGAFFVAVGRPAPEAERVQRSRRLFDEELRVEEGNITEPGEGELVEVLRGQWARYLEKLEAFGRAPEGETKARAYFDALEPQYRAVRDSADRILVLNQDAMPRRSDRAQRSAAGFVRLIIAAALALSLAGAWAATALTGRLLKPLSVVTMAVRRFGEGDLKARARLTGRDEVAALAAEFNDMADRLEVYRKSSLGELLLAQQASQAAIDSLPDPVIMLGLSGELLNVNAAATSLLNLSVEKNSANPLAALSPTIRAIVERMREHVFAGRGPHVPKGFEEAVRFVAADGERYLLPRATPIYGEENEVAGVAVVLSDVTRLWRADELKNNLVAFVAHEFRTPLTSLQMAVHLCTEEAAGPLTEKQADLLFAAREDCNRLQTIVNDLLDVSRVHEGELALSTEALGVEDLVSQALSAHRTAADEKGLSLASEVLPGLAPVLADPERVKLVFANLIGNAIRYTPSGGRIAVRAKAEDGMTRFEVADTGPGIPREQQALVFEKFYRLPGSGSQGAGLGLFIAREVVRAHGGTIGIDSEVGRGTTIWFTLPTAGQS